MTVAPPKTSVEAAVKCHAQFEARVWAQSELAADVRLTALLAAAANGESGVTMAEVAKLRIEIVKAFFGGDDGDVTKELVDSHVRKWAAARREEKVAAALTAALAAEPDDGDAAPGGVVSRALSALLSRAWRRGIADGTGEWLLRAVTVDGVVSRPELNGRSGRVLAYDRARGRCSVEVEGAGRLSLKVDSLKANEDSDELDDEVAAALRERISSAVDAAHDAAMGIDAFAAANADAVGADAADAATAALHEPWSPAVEAQDGRNAQQAATNVVKDWRQCDARSRTALAAVAASIAAHSSASTARRRRRARRSRVSFARRGGRGGGGGGGA